MATSARADAATNGCVCSDRRGEDATALLLCAGADCPLGGFLHASPCASDSERGRYERALDGHESFFCDMCIKSYVPVPLAPLILPGDVVPMQAVDLVEAGDPASIAAPSDSQSAMSRTRELFDLPAIITSFRWRVTQSYLEDLRAERSRRQRENLRIDAATVPFLESVHASIQEIGGKSRLVIERDAQFTPSFISFSWAMPDMIEGGLRLHNVSSVACTDETHQYDKGGCLLGAHVGIVPDAGGAAWPLAWHLVLLPPGSVGLATRHMQESTEFVVSLGYPMPIVTFFDKAEAAHNGWLAAVKCALRSARSEGGPVANVITRLRQIAQGATSSQVLGARLLIRSMPQFCEPASGSLTVPHIQQILRDAHAVAVAGPQVPSLGFDAPVATTAVVAEFTRQAFALGLQVPPAAATVVAAAPQAPPLGLEAPAAATTVVDTIAPQAPVLCLETPAAAVIELRGEGCDARRARTLKAVASTLSVPGPNQSPLEPAQVSAGVIAAGSSPLPLPSDPAVIVAVSAANGLLQPSLLADYPAIVPGIATIALSLISILLPLMLNCNNTGAWNELALQFEWLLAMSAVGGDLAKFLSSFVTVYGLLCIFHVYQALERYAKKRGVVPTPELQRTLIDRFKNVSEALLNAMSGILSCSRTL